MKLIFLSALLALSVSAYCQKTAYPFDKIYLNDSISVYEGLIVEQAPAKYVRIFRKNEKDTIQVNMNTIWKMVRIYPVEDSVKKVTDNTRKSAKNKYIFVELLGSGGVYSINYDFRFNKNISNKWGLRAGIEYLPLNTVNYSGDKLRYKTVLLPVMVSYLAGKKNKFLELAFGAVYIIKKRTGKLLAQDYEYTIKNLGRRIPNTYGIVSVGYRRNPVRGNVMWGIGITPLIGNSFIVPNIGIKIGYRVK